MNMKILVTGRNKTIADDVYRHLVTDQDYSPMKCEPSRGALLDLMPDDIPHVVIICLRDEKKDTVEVYDILEEYAKLGVFHCIVITNESDRKTFINHTAIAKVTFLARPLSLFALYVKLSRIRDELELRGEHGGEAFMEFVNPRAAEGIKRRHILVVDDDAQQLAQIKEHLREFYDVTLVNSGAKAFRYLERFPVDLVLLDYLMPEMDGPEVLTKMRNKPAYRNLPVIFLTGVSEKETVVKTLVELMPQGYVLKPTKKSEIVAKIIDVLG